MLLSNQLVPHDVLVRFSRRLRGRRARVLCRGACRFGCGGRTAAHDADVLYLYRTKRLIVAGVTSHARDLLFEDNTRLVALTEDGVPAVQVRRRDLGDEERRSIRARSGISQSQAARTIKHQGGNNLVLELVTGIARTVACGIPALDHEVGNYSVKNGAVV